MTRYAILRIVMCCSKKSAETWRSVGDTTGDGEIKGAHRSNRKPLAWLGFWRAGRSVRVPRSAFWAMQSKTSSALWVLLRHLRAGYDRSR
jgi:hypothetical protein